jgi:hypothetical protein
MTDQIIKDGVDLEIPKAYSNGYMSAPIPAQFTYLPWDALYEVAKVLTENCVDNGGSTRKTTGENVPTTC